MSIFLQFHCRCADFVLFKLRIPIFGSLFFILPFLSFICLPTYLPTYFTFLYIFVIFFYPDSDKFLLSSKKIRKSRRCFSMCSNLWSILKINFLIFMYMITSSKKNFLVLSLLSLKFCLFNFIKILSFHNQFTITYLNLDIL